MLVTKQRRNSFEREKNGKELRQWPWARRDRSHLKIYHLLCWITVIFREVFQGNISGVEGDSLLVAFHASWGGRGGECGSSTKWINERKGVANMAGIQISPKMWKVRHDWMPVLLWHNTSLPLHMPSRQIVSGMHIHYPSTNAMNCHGEWRRATERERERESEHRGLDSAIYKAWPSACLINCALFWESRKPAGLQERGRQSERNRKKKT